MPPMFPTTLAVADAVNHYRRLRDLTIDELSYVTGLLGHVLPAERIHAIEDRRHQTTVDELMVLAHALDVSPSDLLSHFAQEGPVDGRPLATSLPTDVDQVELKAWVQGRAALDHESRRDWARDRVSRLEVLACHIQDQLEGARSELEELGELADREADAPPVQRLVARIRQSEMAMAESDLALALAQSRLDLLTTKDEDD